MIGLSKCHVCEGIIDCMCIQRFIPRIRNRRHGLASEGLKPLKEAEQMLSAPVTGVGSVEERWPTRIGGR